MRQSETQAKNIVAQAWNVAVQDRDVQTHLGLHDFDILLPGGPEAMEVTTATDQQLRSLYAAMSHEEKLGPAAGRRSWQLTLAPDARVKRVKQNIGQIALGLRSLEEQGIENFIARRDRHRDEVKLFTDQFPDIKDAWAFGPGKSGAVLVMVPPGATAVIGPEAVTRFVEVFVNAPHCEDNRRKLAKAGTNQTHLFLWIEATEFAPFESLCEGVLPEGLPTLPPGITSVWVAAQCRNGRLEVWYVRPPAPWIKVR